MIINDTTQVSQTGCICHLLYYIFDVQFNINQHLNQAGNNWAISEKTCSVLPDAFCQENKNKIIYKEQQLYEK